MDQREYDARIAFEYVLLCGVSTKPAKVAPRFTISIDLLPVPRPAEETREKDFTPLARTRLEHP